MNPVDPEIESRLKSLAWIPIPEETLSASLQAALQALPADSAPAKRKRWLTVIPGPVRWTLAACWTLSLGLRLATPSPPGGASTEMSSASAAAVFNSIQLTNDQIHELEHQLQLDRVAQR